MTEVRILAAVSSDVAPEKAQKRWGYLSRRLKVPQRGRSAFQ
jgi:hypothetical protein